jgi:hypothetical protein
MMQVVGGAWKKGPAAVARSWGGLGSAIKYLALPKGFLRMERVAPRDILSIELVTQEHVKSMAGKAAWGIAGGLLLGGVGALAGVLAGGEKNQITVLVTHRDGRKALLRGKPDEFYGLLGAPVGQNSR